MQALRQGGSTGFGKGVDQKLVRTFRPLHSIDEDRTMKLLDTTRGERILLGIVLCYLFIAMCVSASTGNREFLLYVAVVAVLIVCLTVVHFRVRFPFPLLCCFGIWGAAHMMGGLLQIPHSWPTGPADSHVLYSLWFIPEYFRYDHLVHACGFGSCAWLGWHVMKDDLEDHYTNRFDDSSSIEPTYGRLFRVGLVAGGLGGVNELVEGVATWVCPETNVGGFDNLIGDLVYNTVGIMVVLIIIRWRARR